MTKKLKRSKHTPGSAVQRFGNWRNGEPTVLIDNQKWLSLGKPDELTVTIEPKNEKNDDLDDLTPLQRAYGGKLVTIQEVELKNAQM